MKKSPRTKYGKTTVGCYGVGSSPSVVSSREQQHTSGVISRRLPKLGEHFIVFPGKREGKRRKKEKKIREPGARGGA